MHARRKVVSVIGSGDPGGKPVELAEELGAAIAAEGWSLCCGGRGGVMEAACRGFRGAAGEGVTIGILPTTSASGGNAYLDVAIPTGLGLARNALVVLAGDAVVAVGGGSGTLSEIALAWQLGKPVVGLVPAGGFGAELAGRALDDKRGDTVLSAASVDEAVRVLRALLTSEP